MTNINPGSGARRIIFKRQQCMYRSFILVWFDFCFTGQRRCRLKMLMSDGLTDDGRLAIL